MPSDWGQAQSIGIIFDGTNPAYLSRVEELIREFRVEKRKVRVLMYLELAKKQPIPVTPEGFSIFTQQDINWGFKPNFQKVSDFVNEPFDVLWDLNTELNLPLAYISKWSKARFKAGLEDPLLNHLNLSLRMSQITSSQYRIVDLIENLKRYSQIIHS